VPEPLFDGDFYLIQQRIVGEKHLKLVLSLDEQGQDTVDGIAFNIDTKQWPNTQVTKARMVYQLSVNVFRGRESAQLIIKNISAS